MKKWILIALAFFAFQAQAQDLNALAGAATGGGLSANSMIESLAGDQVKSLTSKLGLNAAQQEQLTSLVTTQLARPEVQKLIGDISPESLLGSNASATTAKVTEALMSQSDFTSGLTGMLSKPQQAKLSALTSKL